MVHTKRNHYIVTHLSILKTPNAQNMIGPFSHMLRYTPRKWISYSQEILRHRSQFLSKQGEKILREVCRISRNLGGAVKSVFFFFFFFFFISSVGKEVKKDETYMAKNTGDEWETMITYPIFYYSHTTLNGDLSMFFFRCNCCWLYM